VAVVAEDDEPISMWPVVIAGAVLAALLGVLLLMMALNDDTSPPHLPPMESEHVSTP
jgi:hypothetical protein